MRTETSVCNESRYSSEFALMRRGLPQYGPPPLQFGSNWPTPAKKKRLGRPLHARPVFFPPCETKGLEEPRPWRHTDGGTQGSSSRRPSSYYYYAGTGIPSAAARSPSSHGAPSTLPPRLICRSMSSAHGRHDQDLAVHRRSSSSTYAPGSLHATGPLLLAWDLAFLPLLHIFSLLAVVFLQFCQGSSSAGVPSMVLYLKDDKLCSQVLM